tara:strand:+ start:438 stop:1574 length:1137 start_codon:yes stop_codon:yes gene_type:complete
MNVKYYRNSQEIKLKNNISMYNLYGNEYKMGYDYGYFNKENINIQNLYEKLCDSIKKKKFNEIDFNYIQRKTNNWINKLDKNEHIDFIKGMSKSLNINFKKILFVIIYFEIFGYYCSIINTNDNGKNLNLRILDSNKIICKITKQFKLPLNIINFNDKYISIKYYLMANHHTLISNKINYAVKSHYRNNLINILDNEYPILFQIFKLYKNSNSIDQFEKKIIDSSLNEKMHILSYDKNKMNLINLHNQKISEKKNSGKLYISDYSKIIDYYYKLPKNKLNTLDNFFELNEILPTRCRLFSVINDINNSDIYVNNFIEKNEFVKINLKNSSNDNLEWNQEDVNKLLEIAEEETRKENTKCKYYLYSILFFMLISYYILV